MRENACYPPDNDPTTTNSSSGGDHPARCVAGADHEEGAGGVQKYLYVFLLANALMGVGATPMYTLGNVYIAENSHPLSTAWYLGTSTRH